MAGIEERTYTRDIDKFDVLINEGNFNKMSYVIICEYMREEHAEFNNIREGLRHKKRSPLKIILLSTKGRDLSLYAYACKNKYSETCVRKPPLRLTLVVDVKRWLSYKGTCHVILLAKLHDMYLYKTDNFSTSTTI